MNIGRPSAEAEGALAVELEGEVDGSAGGTSGFAPVVALALAGAWVCACRRASSAAIIGRISLSAASVVAR
ncbi:hypothetical protein D3C83_252400 [compost metagenome]